MPPDEDLEAPARATRAFSVAVAGLLIASVPEAALCGPKFAQSLAAPWVDARAGRIDTEAPAPVKTGEVDAKTWAQRTGDVISHYDFGVRATNAASVYSESGKLSGGGSAPKRSFTSMIERSRPNFHSRSACSLTSENV